jgi:hypothetical protein
MKIKQYSFHGITNGMTWLVLIPISVLAQRFYPFSESAINAHRAAASAALSLTLPAMGQALVAGGGSASTGNKDFHMIAGFIVAGTLIVQLLSGTLVSLWLRSLAAPPNFWKWFRLVHYYVGYAEFLVAMGNCFVGVYLMFGDFPSQLAALYVLSLVALAALLLIIERRDKLGAVCNCQWRALKDAATVAPDLADTISTRLAQSVNAMTIHEVRHQVGAGRKLIVYQDLVVDVTDFHMKHPGGAFTLEAFLADD